MRLAVMLALALLQEKRVEGRDITSEKIVALTILMEARGEGEGGMYRVGCVIQQRAIEKERRADYICLAPFQFSCWNKLGGTRAELIKKRAWLFESKAAPYALGIARKIIAREKLKREIVQFATHFCTLKSNPFWSRGKNPVAVYGNHKFFRLD